MKSYLEPTLLVLAIIAGSLMGTFSNFKLEFIDCFILSMLCFLFYNVSFDQLLKGLKNKKYLSIAWVCNFILIPSLAFGMASLFIDRSSAVFIGILMYLIAPCTDWFLGFTKLANGDVEVNSALLPINLLSQIILLPIYLYCFTSNTIGIPFDSLLDTLIHWVLVPFAGAQLLKWIIKKTCPKILSPTGCLAELGALISLILLVFCIFNAHIHSLIENAHLLPSIIALIFGFFVIIYYFVRWISRRLKLSKPEEVSLTMTTSARNAPLILGISLALFPKQELIHIVLVIGMLVEFPHLIAVTYLLKRNANSNSAGDLIARCL